jgi:hypothetical protein
VLTDLDWSKPLAAQFWTIHPRLHGLPIVWE